MKKSVSLFLIICMMLSLMIALPITATGTISSGDGSSSGGGSAGVFGPIVSDAPVNITEFSYDDKGNVGFVASNVPDDATVYAGAFDENNRLLELQELSLYNGSTYAKFSADNVDEYRAYIWQNMKPLHKDAVAVQVPRVNKTISISFSDLIDFDGEAVEYYRGDKLDRAELASYGEITFIYNGITVGQYDNSDDLRDAFESCFDIYFDIIYSGQLKLIDDGTANGYSIINLEVPVSAVVDKVVGTRVEFKEIVWTTDGKAFNSLDFDPEETDVSIKLTKNGEEIDYTQLTEWDVLTVLANDMTEDYFVEVIDNKIDGIVEERIVSDTSADGYRYKIGNKWYDLASMAYGGAELKEGTFYIDRYGKIAAFKKSEESDDGVNYAYILNAKVTFDEWENASIRIQWLDKKGEVHDAYLNESVTIENIYADLLNAIEGEGVIFTDETTEDIDYVNAKVKTERFEPEDSRFNILTNALINKFVTYTLSEDSVKTITFPMNEPNEEVYLVNMLASGEASYNENNKLISIDGKKYDVSDNTLVFYINAEEGSVIEDGAIASKYLSMVTKATTLVSGTYKYMEVYDLENDFPKVLVVYDDSIKVSHYSDIAVIEAVDSTSVTYWMNGEKATAYSDYTDMFNVGDIWKFNLNDSTILAAIPITDYYRDINSAGYDGGAVFNISEGAEDCVWGPVTDSRVSTDKISCAYKNDFNDIETFRIWNAPVYVVDETSDEVKVFKGSVADAMYDYDLVDAATLDNMQVVERGTGTPLTDVGEAPLGMMDYVFAVSYDGEIQGVVIYKGGDFGRWRVEEVY